MNLKFCALLVPLLVCPLSAIASDPPEAARFIVEGNWRPEPASSLEAGWVATADGLEFVSGAGMRSEPYLVSLTDPLPDGDWTAELCYRIEGRFHRLALVADQAASSRAAWPIAITDGGDPGTVHFVRVSCSPSRRLMTISTNGWPTTQDLPKGWDQAIRHISLAMSAMDGGSPATVVLRVVHFRMTKGADIFASVSGPAFEGWSLPVKAEALGGVARLFERMDAVLASSPTDKSRSYALVAKMLAEYSTERCVRTATWTAVSQMVADLLPRERSCLAILLPFAAACGDSAQREQVRSWTDSYFNVKYGVQWRDMRASGSDAERMMLVDPVRIMAFAKTLSLHSLPYWHDALVRSSPQYQLLPYASYLQHERWNPSAVAWLLPQLHSVSDGYGDLATSYLLDPRCLALLRPQDVDRRMSFLAYRLAEIDPVASLAAVRRIADPRTKAATIQCVADASSDSARLSPRLASAVETLLRQSIDEFKPTPRRGTPVTEVMSLARLYDEWGQHDKAEKAAAEAVALVGGSERDRFRDTVSIARYKRQHKTSDHQEWWRKAIELAQSADRSAETGGPGSFYVSALVGMGHDLVKSDELDEALDIVAKMDEPKQASSRAMILSRVITKMLNKDIKAAIDLLRQYPEASTGSVAGVIAVELAETDLPQALKLVEPLPKWSRLEALGRIAGKVGRDKLESVVFVIRAAVSDARAGNGIGSGWPLRTEPWSTMPPGVVLSLADAFSAAPDEYAACLLDCVVRSCGLADDPMWIQFSGRSSRDRSVPWGVDRLEDAVRAE